MKIVEEPNIDYKVETGIKSAQYISEYKIQLFFENGSKKIVDFEKFLSNAQHPSIKKYLSLNKFKEFKIINGNLNWNDYDLIFPIADLKRGLIS